MTLEQAKNWLAELNAAIDAGQITKMSADEEVFKQMEEGDHDIKTETLLFDYTRS